MSESLAPIRANVVIPVYNRAHLIERTLNSIKAQTYRPIRVVVTDNASSDDSLAVAGEWARRNSEPGFEVTVIEEHRPGAARARQTGYEALGIEPDSRNETVIFFDSDDEMLPDLIAEGISAFERRPGLEMYAWRVMLDVDGARRQRHFSTTRFWECHLYNGMLVTGSMMLAPRLIERAGGWNTSLGGWDDWEFSARLLLHSTEAARLFDNRALSVNYYQKESLTGVDYSSRQGQWERAIDTLEADFDDADPSVRATLRLIMAYRRAILAAHYMREGNGEGAGKILETLRQTGLGPVRRRVLRSLYHYTRLGGRGAYHLWSLTLPAISSTATSAH